MTRRIHTLVTDIYASLASLDPEKLPPSSSENGEELQGLDAAARNIKDRLKASMLQREGRDQLGNKVLYASDVGSPCLRKMWYKLRADKYPPILPAPNALIKFAYGDIIEELILFYAEQAGHEVVDRQREVELPLDAGWRLRGRIDAVIDGELVDVKSCSKYTFEKIVNGDLTPDKDSFGYLGQLGTYAADPQLVPYGEAHFLCVDKTLGYVGLGSYSTRTLGDPVATGNKMVKAVTQSTPPTRGFSDVSEGKSGNRVLCMECSYCPFKHHCWPGTRTFLSYKGPVTYTRVVKEPRMVEVKSNVA